MPSPPQFPPELWSITIQNFRHRRNPDDLTYLWTTVRHVSRQFKEEIENIFRTEHLPKTWLYVDIATLLHNSPVGRKIDDFSFKLNFDKIQPRCPGRAVFSIRAKDSSQKRHSSSAYQRKMFRRLRDELGTGRLGEADKSVSGSRIRLFESPGGMFVTQVRGSVSDCALPALSIDSIKNELSFEWRDMFDRYFGQRKMTTTVLLGAPVDQAPASALKSAVVKGYSPSLQIDMLVNRLNPSLQALAQLDWNTYTRQMQVSNEARHRIQLLKSPIQTWTEAMGEEFGKAKATLKRCRLLKHADQEIDLDDEGGINRARMDWEEESNKAAESRGRAEWILLTRACDACRMIDRPCDRGDIGTGFPRDCGACLEAGSPCDSSLACLNFTRPHYVSQNYQMQLMLLEQQNKKRLFMTRQMQDSKGQSSSQPHRYPAPARPSDTSQNHALQDYQMQLMLLEQQKKKRLTMARQQRDSRGSQPSHSQPTIPGSLTAPHSSNASQINWTGRNEMQASARMGRNEQHSIGKSPEPVVGRGQNPRSVPSQPGADSQPSLSIRSFVEQDQMARDTKYALRRRPQQEPLMARDPFAQLPPPSGHLDHGFSAGCSKP